MKKLSLCILFIFIFVTSCQGLDQTETAGPTKTVNQAENTSPTETATATEPEDETELVLLYYCDGMVQDVCYKDLKTGQPEGTLPIRGYRVANWDSPEQVLVSEYITAYDEPSTEYYMFDTRANSMECITCDLNIIGRKQFSPSRQKIAIYHYDRIEIMSLGASGEIEATVSGFEAVSSVEWSPDESFIIFMDGMTLYRFNLKDQSLIKLVNEPSAIQIFYPSLSPAGDKLAFYLLDKDHNLYLAGMSVDKTEYEILVDLTPSGRTIGSSENTSTSFSWSPEGDRLVFTNEIEEEGDIPGHDGIYIVDFADGQSILIDDTLKNKWSVAWSPDGSLIAFVADAPGTPSDIWTINPDGTHLVNRTVTPERSEFGPGWK